MDEQGLLYEALSKRLVTHKQVEAARKVQERMDELDMEASLWDVLILQGALRREQVDELMGTKRPRRETKFGTFTLEEKIGEGGMGTVYRARRKDDPAPVALKILSDKCTADKELVQRFEREARYSTKLKHPNLVHACEFGRCGERWYLALELIEGDVLADLIHERGRLNERMAMTITLQVAQALDAIHRANLVHRDVKPSNIMIERSGQAKLMDLGLAKSIQTSLTPLTRSGYSVGTPSYMAPEQIEGKHDVDIRTDIYGLGATLYFMVIGEPPFHGRNLKDLIERQLKHKLDSPKELRPELSDPFCHVIELMMARGRDDRYATPAVLIADLENLLQGNAPISTRIRVGRSIVRRPRGETNQRG